MTYAIQTESLSRSFGTVKAVDRLSLNVPTGSVFGFLGPNGSGKTTTIRLLLGLLDAEEGKANVLGFDTKSQADEIRLRCGSLLEHHGLYERLTAEDNLNFYGRIWHLQKSELNERVKGLLADMGLWDRRHEQVGKWSRGMKQKLAIARTLIHRPKLVFLDEPTAGLDPIAAATLHEDLSNLTRREGVTIFLTTHNLAEAEKLCQEVGVIRNGKLLAVGALDRLREQAGGPRVKITGSNFSETAISQIRKSEQVADIHPENGKLVIRLKEATEIAPFVSLLVQAGAQIEEVRKDNANLEETFMALVNGSEEKAHV
ncbi:MAG: ABC transporter ATP-binding protein [Anaerolineae bacterium]|jgi:ABC-2 type transport system ATP-binding protein|nr:ABC transporter ATP-binding protein [Anaerolineae bacterium]MBT7071472.1 ABC transporter ATP-binding protein [Anaerolineae bacterium]MBT7324829.1 ABC transporter ATP-binding protein [Anaerolineae bacterium]